MSNCEVARLIMARAVFAAAAMTIWATWHVSTAQAADACTTAESAACTKPANVAKKDFCDLPKNWTCCLCARDASAAQSPFDASPTFKSNYSRAFEGDDGEGEIYEGREAKPGQFSETVLLTTRELQSPPPICTGVLIADTVVITARHCTEKGIGARGSTVYFGQSLAKATRDVASQRKVVDSRPINLAGDIEIDAVLLRLDRNAGPSARRAVLAREQTLNANALLRVVGFGESVSQKPQTKLYTDVVIASYACGRAILWNNTPPPKLPTSLFGCRSGIELVAGYLSPEPGRRADTCHGDSGGPAFVVDAQIATPLSKFHFAFEPRARGAPTPYYLAAITRKAVDTSYVPAGDTKCGNGGRYTRLLGQVKAAILQEARRPPWNAVVQTQR